jgi:hypothetical protein
MDLNRTEVQQDLDTLRRRITEGPGVTSPAERQAAAAGAFEATALGAYLDRVRYAAIEVTDEEVAALRAGGLSDDALFELTVAAALGAADRMLAGGLAAIAAAEEAA